MCVVQRTCELLDQQYDFENGLAAGRINGSGNAGRSLAERIAPTGCNVLRQGFAFDVAHREEWHAIGFARIEQGADAWVIELRDRVDLTAKALPRPRE